jgi:stearoyl-CoA desaturase (delta-9 desaturase)
MRFWLWMTTGMVTKEWVAVHRKHHRFTDEVGDPHSPHVYGIKNILFKGVMRYVEESRDKKTLDNYGQGTPNDAIERELYSEYPYLGIIILLLINLVLFGIWGALIWLVQMAWIPFWAAGVINGLGHWFGYRNTDTKDKSTNLIPIGLIIGGEELHNNHHNKPASAKLSEKWFEFDIGWFWIKVFSYIGLIKIKEVEYDKQSNIGRMS